MMLDPKALAHVLGGEAHGRRIVAPGPGHGRRDRSLSIKIDPSAPDGFIVNSFAGDDFREARDYVKERAGLGDGASPPHREEAQAAGAWRSILPVPDDAPKATSLDMGITARDAGRLFSYRYINACGRLLGYVVRVDDENGGKSFRPLTFCEEPGGRREWRCKGFPEPRPLYGLDRLAARPDAPVLVVEGEKAADAADILFPDFVSITSPGGSKAAVKADWSPLVGRHVVIWPDNDDAGARYAGEVTAAAEAAGAASVCVVALPGGLPPKWDLADDFPTGLSFPDIEAALRGARGAEPRPIASSLPSVLPFMPQLLPPVIGDYVMDIADRQQAPADFAAVTALCALASLVGNRVRIAPKEHDDWVVVPNLWGAIIGRPSAMKSPAMKSALAPLYAIQDRMRETWQEETQASKLDAALAVLDGREAKKRAEKAIKSGDRDEARNIIAGIADEEGEETPCPRVLVNDATVEKLGELLNENPRGLLLVRDELPGFLSRMEKEEYASERAFYLEAFNGDGSFTFDRIGRGTVHIENCTLGLIGGIQPSRLAPIVRGAVEGATDDGLIQRLQLAVWPDDIGSWKWTDRAPNRDARDAYVAAFDALHGSLPGSPEHPQVLRFSASAQHLFREWMEELQTEARSGGLPCTIESHILKMPATVASLALLFELVGGGRLEVGEVSIRRALGWAEYLRSHANRLYASGGTVIEDAARLILDRRSQLPNPFTVRDVWKKGWAGLADRKTAEAAIDALVTTNHCRKVNSAPASGGGRPTASFSWHPSLER